MPGFFPEPLFLKILEIENLDDFTAGKGLVQKRVQLRHGFLGAGGKPSDPSAENQYRIKRQRQDDKGAQGQLPVPVKNHEQKRDHGKKIPEYIDHGRGDHAFDNVHVIGDPGHQGPGFFLVDKGQGQIGDPVVQRFPEIPDNALANEVHQVFRSERARAFEQKYQHGQGRNQHEHVPVFCHENVVDHRFDQKGHGPVGDRHHDHAQRCNDQLQPVLQYQVHNFSAA